MTGSDANTARLLLRPLSGFPLLDNALSIRPGGGFRLVGVSGLRECLGGCYCLHMTNTTKVIDKGEGITIRREVKSRMGWSIRKKAYVATETALWAVYDGEEFYAMADTLAEAETRVEKLRKLRESL